MSDPDKALYNLLMNKYTSHTGNYRNQSVLDQFSNSSSEVKSTSLISRPIV